jgi:hypothetical protein
MARKMDGRKMKRLRFGNIYSILPKRNLFSAQVEQHQEDHKGYHRQATKAETIEGKASARTMITGKYPLEDIYWKV